MDSASSSSSSPSPSPSTFSPPSSSSLPMQIDHAASSSPSPPAVLYSPPPPLLSASSSPFTIHHMFYLSSLFHYFETFSPVFSLDPNHPFLFRPDDLLHGLQCRNHSHSPSHTISAPLNCSNYHRWNYCHCNKSGCQYVAELHIEILSLLGHENVTNSNWGKILREEIDKNTELKRIIKEEMEIIEGKMFSYDGKEKKNVKNNPNNSFIDNPIDHPPQDISFLSSLRDCSIDSEFISKSHMNHSLTSSLPSYPKFYFSIHGNDYDEDHSMENHNNSTRHAPLNPSRLANILSEESLSLSHPLSHYHYYHLSPHSKLLILYHLTQSTLHLEPIRSTLPLERSDCKTKLEDDHIIGKDDRGNTYHYWVMESIATIHIYKEYSLSPPKIKGNEWCYEEGGKERVMREEEEKEKDVIEEIEVEVEVEIIENNGEESDSGSDGEAENSEDSGADDGEERKSKPKFKPKPNLKANPSSSLKQSKLVLTNKNYSKMSAMDVDDDEPLEKLKGDSTKQNGIPALSSPSTHAPTSSLTPSASALTNLKPSSSPAKSSVPSSSSSSSSSPSPSSSSSAINSSPPPSSSSSLLSLPPSSSPSSSSASPSPAPSSSSHPLIKTGGIPKKQNINAPSVIVKSSTSSLTQSTLNLTKSIIPKKPLSTSTSSTINHKAPLPQVIPTIKSLSVLSTSSSSPSTHKMIANSIPKKAVSASSSTVVNKTASVAAAAAAANQSKKLPFNKDKEEKSSTSASSSNSNKKTTPSASPSISHKKKPSPSTSTSTSSPPSAKKFPAPAPKKSLKPKAKKSKKPIIRLEKRMEKRTIVHPRSPVLPPVPLYPFPYSPTGWTLIVNNKVQLENLITVLSSYPPCLSTTTLIGRLQNELLSQWIQMEKAAERRQRRMKTSDLQIDNIIPADSMYDRPRRSRAVVNYNEDKLLSDAFKEEGNERNHHENINDDDDLGDFYSSGRSRRGGMKKVKYNEDDDDENNDNDDGEYNEEEAPAEDEDEEDGDDDNAMEDDDNDNPHVQLDTMGRTRRSRAVIGEDGKEEKNNDSDDELLIGNVKGQRQRQGNGNGVKSGKKTTVLDEEEEEEEEQREGEEEKNAKKEEKGNEERKEEGDEEEEGEEQEEEEEEDNGVEEEDDVDDDEEEGEEGVEGVKTEGEEGITKTNALVDEDQDVTMGDVR